MNTSRRHFLRAASGITAASAGALAQPFCTPLAMSLAGIGSIAAHNANAADTSNGYRALVCLFMDGGNDSHNWVVPTDPSGYAEYASARGGLALPVDALSPITSSGQDAGRNFGMPTELQPLRNWYETGHAAIVANVGTLVQPVTKKDYMAGRNLPSKLFSHNDQKSTWQSLLPEGAPSGWGGRMGDILMSANQQPVFTAVSTFGNAVFLSGSKVTQYQVARSGPVSVRSLAGSHFMGSNTAGGILKRSVASSGSTAFQAEYARVVQRAMASDGVLRTALAGTSIPAIPATKIRLPAGEETLNNNELAQQLYMVSKLIAAGQSMGMRRQIFMVRVTGFDTHSSQMEAQPVLMSRVAHSIDYFLSSMNSIGMLNNVLLFTASDFGRTLTTNGDGSDHGWGSHHFVVGGGVKGRKIYGRFPVTALNTEDDIGSGRLLPGIAVTELAATLGGWMGLSSTDLSYVLPTLSNFSNQNIGFV